MKIVTLIIFLFIFGSASCQTDKDPLRDTHNSILQALIPYPSFKMWYDYWNDKFPDIDIMNVSLNLHNKYQLPSFHQYEKSLTDELHYRKYTLVYSPNGEYCVDIYNHLVFEKLEGDSSLLIRGGDVDKSFSLYKPSFNMGTQYFLGTTVSIDDIIWTSETTFYLLGFSFDPITHKKVFIVKCDIIDNEVITYLSEENFPFSSSGSSKEYMNLKFPKVQFTY